MSDNLIRISAALQARVQAFQSMSLKGTCYAAVPELRGAAQLALDVAALANNQWLREEALAVIRMLDDLERSAEDEEHASRQHEWDELEQRRVVRKDNYRLVQTVIGMELEDPRWEELVKRYQQAFPTFKIAASVKTRISPKSLSSVLRKEVVELLQQRNKDRIIGLREIEAVRGEAMQTLENLTLRYLGKALPGFDFHAILPTRAST